MSEIYAQQVELTKAKIVSMLTEYDSIESIFSDKRFLESLSLHGFIIGREKEAKKILDLIYPRKNNYLVPFVSIIGRSGTGKTTIAKLICESISDYISYSFVNLRKSKTLFGCANMILSQLDGGPVKSSEGINKAIDLIETRIVEILQRDKKQHFVLVLDEFDVIFSDTRNHPSDFLYKLLTIAENLRAKQLWLCVVAISNSDLSNYTLDERVKSRIDNHEVIFPPYAKEEILKILHNRAAKAFAVPIGNDVLKKCAQLASDENGDCRRSLQLLRMAGEIAKGKEITVSDVENAARELNKERYLQVLENVTPHQKTLLAALAKNVLCTEKEEHSTQEIHSTYNDLCSQSGMRSLSYRRSFDLLADLENTGIIVSRTNSNGRHGYHNFYRLTAHFDLVGSWINPNWWYAERDNKVRVERFEEEGKEKYKLAQKERRRIK